MSTAFEPLVEIQSANVPSRKADLSRLIFTVDLHLNASREPSALDMYWQCKCSARARKTYGSFFEPSELVIEDLAVESVERSAISYSQSSGWWPCEADGDVCLLNQLNFWLDDDSYDWQDIVRKAAQEKFQADYFA